jgi:hypothetical protein
VGAIEDLGAWQVHLGWQTLQSLRPKTAPPEQAFVQARPAVRLDAVRDMLRSRDDATVAMLRERLGVETNSSVKKEIATGLALAALDGSDTKARLDAIATLSESVSQDVRNGLAHLLDKSPDDSFVESDEKVRGPLPPRWNYRPMAHPLFEHRDLFWSEPSRCSS